MDSIWAQDSVGRPYIFSSAKVPNAGAPTQILSKTEQTLDLYGNVTERKVSTTTPALRL